jgi:hypothetical protein
LSPGVVFFSYFWVRRYLSLTRVIRSAVLVVGVVATGPKVCGFEPNRSDGFLRAIRISSTRSFRIGGKVGGLMSWPVKT